MIGVIVYFYYNCKNSTTSNNSNIKTTDDISVSTNNKSPKKVRFNDKIKYNTYKKNFSDSSKIDVDSIFSSRDISSASSDSNRSKSPGSVEFDRSKIINRSKSNNSSNSSSSQSVKSNNSLKNNSNVVPYSKDDDDGDTIWDAHFGLPLTTKNEKQKYIKQLHKNHDNYQKSLGKFNHYQTDNGTLIQTDVTINPFKPIKSAKSLKGRSIKEIYDQQVAGPKAKPKKIRSISNSGTVYDDELEMNGGKIKGTNMCGFEGGSEFRPAAFGNEF